MATFTFQPGDLVLVKVNRFTTWYRWLFAQLIRLFDGVYYHHAQIFFDGALYEAETTVRTVPPAHNVGQNILVLRLQEPLSYRERQLLAAHLQVAMRKKYDYTGAIVHHLIHILSFRRLWLGRRGQQAAQRPYCTELVAYLMFKVRGYFPDFYKTAPSRLLAAAPLYYYVAFEGLYSLANEADQKQTV